MFSSIDWGLFILRLGIGLNMAIFSGWGMLTGGTPMLSMVGGSMPSFGISWMPLAWGCMAAFAEFFCSLLLVLGVYFRLAACMLCFTMLVAISAHLRMPADNPMAGWHGASHALAFLSVFAALLLTGPGKHVLTLKK